MTAFHEQWRQDLETKLSMLTACSTVRDLSSFLYSNQSLGGFAAQKFISEVDQLVYEEMKQEVAGWEFVSYEDDERTMHARVARRTAIEGALARAVADVGAVTGVGFGVKTTYIDLALCNLETGLARLVSKLRDLDAPARSFIQFFDSELADEWLSIWPDSRLTEG